MESWITLFTRHGKAKVQLSRVLQTEYPQFPEIASYTHYQQCRLLQNPPYSESFIFKKMPRIDE